MNHLLSKRGITERLRITPMFKKLSGYIRYNQKEAWDAVAYSFLESLNPIVDIGCGEGRFLARNPKTIIGFDWNGRSIQKCRDRGYNVVQGDIRALPFEDESVSGIHCSHVIEHFLPSDVHKILCECDRVLMPQGILVIRSPLLWRGFYSDLTHIRPYDPAAILRYFTPRDQHTLDTISTAYRMVSLRWRYGPPGMRVRLPETLSRILNLSGLPWWTKSGYMLVIQKRPTA